MKRFLTWATMMASVGVAASAMTLDEKQCVTVSAQKLPQIVGSEITASRVSPGKLEDGSDPGDMKLIDVELDVKAAGVEQTYSYLCFFKEGDPLHLAVERGVK